MLGGMCLTISIFAQNNGVIALTRCANRKAGFVCASFLILYGVLGKLSGVFLSIPNPVLGGVTTCKSHKPLPVCELTSSSVWLGDRCWYQGSLIYEVHPKRPICSRCRGFFRIWKYACTQMGYVLV